MESLDESKLSSKLGFFKYLFKFDEEVRFELFNLIQYACIAIIPIVLLNKGMQRFVPEADEEKSSLEILAEVLIQIIVIFIGLFYIDRIVQYIPTYSGHKYHEFTLISVVLSILMITLSLQTKLGEKVSILSERLMEMWDGEGKKKKKKKNNSSDSQNQSPMPQILQPQQPITQQNHVGSTSINQLPQQVPVQQMNNGPSNNYDEPYGGSMIMAANEALGGSAFGANF
jgi:hypothetical protein